MENNNSRRNFLKKSATLALGAIAATTITNTAFSNNVPTEEKNHEPESGKFTLPALPYGYDALEPHIDTLTMEIHHSKHHQSYVTNLNKALETVDTDILSEAITFSAIFKNINELPVSFRNNAGGHYNHSLFWTLMKPNGGGEPKRSLAKAITSTFGSFAEFKKQFADAAMKRFGSGWAWLVVSNGKLVITSTPNQDNPLMQLNGIEIKGTPVLALDVWEHAYYLKNQNRRAEYIAAWWNVVNWETAEDIYIAASK
jgi:superoxide dismutase, Fe-Mn family